MFIEGIISSCGEKYLLYKKDGKNTSSCNNNIYNDKKEKIEKSINNFIEEKFKHKRKIADTKRDFSNEKFCKTLDAKDQEKL